MKTIQHNSILMGLLLCCWLMGGCEKEVIVPDLEGNLVGYLAIFDEYGTELEDFSNVHITTNGLDGHYSVISDAGGRYEFKNLPAGTYELTFEKEGFGKEILKSVKHLGGKPTVLGIDNNNRIYPNVYIFQYPESAVQSISIEGEWLIGEFNAGDGGSHWQYYVFVFFSAQNGFDMTSAVIRCFEFIRQDNGVYKAQFNKDEFDFSAGQTIYCKSAVVSKAYAGCIQLQEDGSYFSCSYNELIYPPIGNVSGQFSFVFPN